MAEIVVVASGTAGPASVLARRLAAEGAHIAILAMGKQALGIVAGELVKLGAPNVLAIPCDLTDAAQVQAASARVESELGPIDTWINTAMSEHGFVCATRTALACMASRNTGSVVQVAAPRSVRLFTQGLAGELRVAGSNIVLQCVRTQPFRKLGAAVAAGAAVVGAALLRRVVR